MPSEPEFQNPEGFGPPQGVEPGQTFEAVAVLRLKPDGQLCLVSLDGSEFEPDDKDYSEDEETEEVEVEEKETMDKLADSRGFAERIMTS